MASSPGNPFITNKIPTEQKPIGADGKFVRQWVDYFQGLSNGLANAELEFRDSDLIGPQIGATSGMDAQTFLVSLSNQADTSSGAFVPVLLAVGDTFMVPEDTQALFAMTIDVQGTLVVDGYLVQVN